MHEDVPKLQPSPVKEEAVVLSCSSSDLEVQMTFLLTWCAVNVCILLCVWSVCSRTKINLLSACAPARVVPRQTR